MFQKDGRRTLRTRKVSQAMAVVDDASRMQATQARLDALEADNDAGDALAADSDDEEVVIETDDEDGEGGGSTKKSKKGKKVGSKRKTRGSGQGGAGKGMKSFTRLLEDSIMDQGKSGGPNYLSAAAGPPALAAPRKFCSVCGNSSQYTCSRCRSRYCCRKCYAVHTETRCLKFTL